MTGKTLVSRLFNFFRLRASDRQLPGEAALAVPVIRPGLTILPFPVVDRAIRTAPRSLRRWSPAGLRAPGRIVRAVTVVAARTPRARCLTQALAGRVLPERRGYSSIVRMGVAKNGDGTLRAHAWLELDGETILGASEPDAFVAVPESTLSVSAYPANARESS